MRSQCLLVAGLSILLLAPLAPADEPDLKLNIVVVEGEGAVNNIKLRTSRQTIVQVEDENRKPAAGAVVAFLLPDYGPGGTFVGGSKIATEVTDSSGRAVMPRLRVNSNAGRYIVRVTASHQGLVANVTIAQSSIAGAAAISTAGIIGIVVGAAAAGGVAAVVATKGKGSTQQPQLPAGTVGAGSGTVFGPPH